MLSSLVIAGLLSLSVPAQAGRAVIHDPQRSGKWSDFVVRYLPFDQKLTADFNSAFPEATRPTHMEIQYAKHVFSLSHDGSIVKRPLKRVNSDGVSTHTICSSQANADSMVKFLEKQLAESVKSINCNAFVNMAADYACKISVTDTIAKGMRVIGAKKSSISQNPFVAPVALMPSVPEQEAEESELEVPPADEDSVDIPSAHLGIPAVSAGSDAPDDGVESDAAEELPRVDGESQPEIKADAEVTAGPQSYQPDGALSTIAEDSEDSEVAEKRKEVADTACARAGVEDVVVRQRIGPSIKSIATVGLLCAAYILSRNANVPDQMLPEVAKMEAEKLAAGKEVVPYMDPFAKFKGSARPQVSNMRLPVPPVPSHPFHYLANFGEHARNDQGKQVAKYVDYSSKYLGEGEPATHASFNEEQAAVAENVVSEPTISDMERNVSDLKQLRSEAIKTYRASEKSYKDARNAVKTLQRQARRNPDLVVELNRAREQEQELLAAKNDAMRLKKEAEADFKVADRELFTKKYGDAFSLMAD